MAIWWHAFPTDLDAFKLLYMDNPFFASCSASEKSPLFISLSALEKILSAIILSKESLCINMSFTTIDCFIGLLENTFCFFP